MHEVQIQPTDEEARRARGIADEAIARLVDEADYEVSGSPRWRDAQFG